jgi:hypothetical protein
MYQKGAGKSYAKFISHIMNTENVLNSREIKSLMYSFIIHIKTQKQNSMAFSLQANYVNWMAATCWRS